MSARRVSTRRVSAARVVVLGAGGHAKVVVSTLRAAGYHVDALFDDDPAKWGRTVAGVTVAGPLQAAAGYGVIGIGHNRTRQQVAQSLGDVTWVSVVHPAAWVDPTAQVGVGSVVFAGAVIQPDAIVGEHSIINTGATVDHDCVVGDFVHLCPGSHLAGGVTLEAGAFAGAGSAVVPGVRLGAWSVLGAGGVAIRDVPPGVTVAGVPARELGRAQR